MSQPQFGKQPCRPREHLATAGQLYPKAWQRVDEFRADRGTGGLPDWPAWCFLPLAAAHAIVSEDAGTPYLSVAQVGDVGRLGALAAWRVTQGIYRFDPAVYDAVRATPIGREIPCSVLYRMPEWCVYLETPGMQWRGADLHGVWAHLEWDAGTGRTELRLLTDCDAGLLPMILHLGAWDLAEAIDRVHQESIQSAATRPGLKELAQAAAGFDLKSLVQPVVEPVVSLLLYVCSQASEIGDGSRQPSNPAPKHTKRGWRLFPADKPTTWDVGVRMGSALRRAYQARQTGESAGHAGPEPHVRVAHWHGFWSGPLKRADGSEVPATERRFDVRWLPPIAVNVKDTEQLAAVIRPVK